jgi:hypothetical protein
LLAASEEEHWKAIETMMMDVAPVDADSKVLEKSRNVFQGLLQRKNLIEMLKGDLMDIGMRSSSPWQG